MSGNCSIFKHYLVGLLDCCCLGDEGRVEVFCFLFPSSKRGYPAFNCCYRINPQKQLLVLKDPGCIGISIQDLLYPAIAGPTFTRALKNLCNWFWFWTVQYPAFLSHWNTFWLITNQILLPTTFWSNYSPSESIQRWVKTKKILLITSVTQYYKFTLLPKQKSGIPPWSSSCPIFFSLHNVHTTSNTYELVNSISNKAVTTYTGELKYFPTSLCFYFPLLLYFQKRFLLNAGALHGSQTAAD